MILAMFFIRLDHSYNNWETLWKSTMDKNTDKNQLPPELLRVLWPALQFGAFTGKPNIKLVTSRLLYGIHFLCISKVEEPLSRTGYPHFWALSFFLKFLTSVFQICYVRAYGLVRSFWSRRGGYFRLDTIFNARTFRCGVRDSMVYTGKLILG